MSKYYLNSGLRGTKPLEFRSDREAWEELRKLFLPKNVYMTLYKISPILINKPEVFVKSWNKAYSDKLDPKAKTMERAVPILTGLTRHKWGFNKDNIS